MTTAREVQIREAIVAELNNPARNWSQPFTAEGRWRPRYGKEEPKDLQVAVITATLGNEELARVKRKLDFGIDLVLQKRVPPNDVVECDALTRLAEEIHDYYLPASGAHHELTTLAGYKVLSAERLEIYDVEELYWRHTWTTVIALSVRGYV